MRGGSSWIPEDMSNKPSLGALDMLALLQGLQSLVSKYLHKVMIFGGSRHVIFKLINGYSSSSINCCHLYDKENPLMSKSYELFHILRHNNSAADALANMGASLPQGHYSLNENVPITKFIP